MADDESRMDRIELVHRQGGFGNFVVDGKLYEHPDGKKIWWIIITSPTSGRSDEKRVNVACRVSGDEFQCFEVGIAISGFERKMATLPADK